MTIPAGNHGQPPVQHAPQSEDALLNAIATAPSEQVRNELLALLEQRRAAQGSK